MIDGTFIPEEYDALINGKIFKGKCEDVKYETKFDGLDDMTAFGLKVMCYIGHKFDNGDYYVTYDRGETFKYSVTEYKMEGERVILTHPGGAVELSEGDAHGTFYYKHGHLIAHMNGEDSRISIILKKV